MVFTLTWDTFETFFMDDFLKKHFSCFPHLLLISREEKISFFEKCELPPNIHFLATEEQKRLVSQSLQFIISQFLHNNQQPITAENTVIENIEEPNASATADHAVCKKRIRKPKKKAEKTAKEEENLIQEMETGTSADQCFKHVSDKEQHILDSSDVGAGGLENDNVASTSKVSCVKAEKRRMQQGPSYARKFDALMPLPKGKMHVPRTQGKILLNNYIKIFGIHNLNFLLPLLTNLFIF